MAVVSNADAPLRLNTAIAHGIAMRAHHGQRTRSGDLVVEHLGRVAAAVAPDARATAWLHDLFERTDTPARELRAQGFSVVELRALELLTRAPGESYELYALGIAHAPGLAGRLARVVKLADLDDHLRRPAAPGDPPYAWARRHIATVQERWVA